jgi:intracellular septation protein
LRNPTFIKWKPTIVYWLLSVSFLVSHFLSRPPFVQGLLKTVFDMPDRKWNQLNAVWVVFFAAAGVLNLYVAFNYSEDTWVNFKLFGLMGVTFAFMMGQAFLFRAHLIDAGADSQ